ncbi:arylsulfotransferase [Natronomonas amylolytica]|uniref:arylsulfotransferase n=1 Tax=Natronomonas amylolytica TaxID=3108498 RepID=UPI003008E763
MRARPALVLAVLLVLSLALGPAVAAQPDDRPNPCVGTVTDQPDENTLVSIQGAHLTSDGYEKRPALLVSFGPNGSFEWARNASANGRWWAYDVDPLPNGNVIFVTTESGATVVGELDPETNDYVWTKHFDGPPNSSTNPQVTDAHDIDLLDDGELVAADKGEGHERLLVYNRTRGETTWEWRFENHPEHFPESGGGPADDWTHVNDVDVVNVSESDRVDATGEWFMASVRNFDQVAFINRSSKEVELTLGEDDNDAILDEHHNPDHLWGPNGEHTVLVADSLNDRVVEYEYDHASEEWDRVWAATGFDEPRDADRLPNGNTLVSDRMGHRTVEITPDGEVVWEVYTPYETYDAERGDAGSNGPTMREYGAEGTVEAHGDANFSDEEIADCAADLYSFAPSESGFAPNLPSDDPNTSDDGGIPLVPLAAGGVVVLLAALGAVGYRYRG